MQHSSAQRDSSLRPSGLPRLGDVPWGTHLCQFYRTEADLLDMLVPFFKAGLEANECCLWITADSLPATEAVRALAKAVEDLPERMQRRQIEILDYKDWYLRSEALSAEDVLRGWLAHEAMGRACGYDGLRISGDTFWLERKHWDNFVAYEATVHRAFHTQRIIALCSYSLNQCSAIEIIDVLRNHGSALVRRNNQWESIQSATQMLVAVKDPVALEDASAGLASAPGAVYNDGDRPADVHAVRFFRESDFPGEDIGRYLLHGLAEGEAALVFATTEHSDRIASAMRTLGVDVETLTADGRLVVRDAEEIARSVLAGHVPDEAQFQRLVGSEVRRAIAGNHRVRAYGEIVDVLAKAGNQQAAIQLERWWNTLLHDKPVRLLCGYALEGFSEATSVPVFRHICDAHAVIQPVERVNDAEHDRVVAELEQAIVALDTETRERQRVEHEQTRLREAERAARVEAELLNKRLASLQQLTSAMSEATTLVEIGRAVVDGLEHSFAADVATLFIAVDEGENLLLVEQKNLSPSQSQALRFVPAAAPLPAADAYRTRRPVWLTSPAELAPLYPALDGQMSDLVMLGCMPLLLRHACFGVIVLGYKSAHRRDVAERALLDDYVKQIGLAVERSLAYESAHRARMRLQMLADAGRRIAQAKLDLNDVTRCLVEEATRRKFADGCAVHLLTDDGETLTLVALHHPVANNRAAAERLLRHAPLRTEVNLIGDVTTTGRPVRFCSNDEALAQSRGAYRAYFKKFPVSGLLAVPLRASRGVIGMLSASRDFPSQPFSAEDEQLLHELADRAALSIENAMLYERAQRERSRAEAANGAKDEFLAMLGHELRNPLSPILTAVHLMRLRGGELLAKERTIIERQVHHMVRLVDDLLDVSRIARGKIELKRTPMELADAVANAVEIASPLLEERRHRLVTHVPTAGLLVDADAPRLAQVIANLLSNAAKYTPMGGLIEVAARASGDKAALRVCDNGVGIEADLLPRIFNLFAQGKQAIDRAQGGLGLGLTIAHNITEMHGGRLYGKSDGPGKGAEFVLELPLLAVADSTAASSMEQSTQTMIQDRKILVVDDNTDAADSLSEALQLLGHVVQVAYDGPSALRVAQTFRPDLALLDIGLPAMDGYELGQQLRVSLSDTPLKLVALTGYGQDTDRRRTTDAGFDRHLVKPVDFDRLQAVIEELFPVG